MPDLDAVGGVFVGDDAPGLLALLQRNEYLRYGRDISRRHGRVFVLTGTASLFRADALTAVAAARGSVLPGDPGDVYDTYSLTEDNELTIALKTLGARHDFATGMSSAHRIDADVAQPVASTRNAGSGAHSENIGMYGVSLSDRSLLDPTIRPRLRLPRARLLPDCHRLVLFRLRDVRRRRLLGGARSAVLRRAHASAVWPGGWAARLLAAPLLIELAYAIFLQLVYVKSLIDIAFGHSKHWNAAIVESTAT